MKSIYTESIKYANSDAFYSGSSLKRPYGLISQILRDKLFLSYSGETNLLKYQPNYFSIICAVTKAIFRILFNLIVKETVLCVKLNTFNYPYFCYINCQKLISSHNPLLGLRIIAEILSINSYKKRYYKKILFQNDLKKFDINQYRDYHKALVSAVIVKRYYKRLIYFSNGSPSYGRFFFTDFHELQHGVVHSAHPINNPIVKQRGTFFVLSHFEYSKNLNYSIINIPFKKSNDLSMTKVCFPPGGDGESSFLKCLENTFHDINFIIQYHPLSKNYKKMHNLIERRYQYIQNSDLLVIGFSSLIIECETIRKRPYFLILTADDFSYNKLTIDSTKDLRRVREYLEDYFSIKLYHANIILQGVNS